MTPYLIYKLQDVKMKHKNLPKVMRTLHTNRNCVNPFYPVAVYWSWKLVLRNDLERKLHCLMKGEPGTKDFPTWQ